MACPCVTSPLTRRSPLVGVLGVPFSFHTTAPGFAGSSSELWQREGRVCRGLGVEQDSGIDFCLQFLEGLSGGKQAASG